MWTFTFFSYKPNYDNMDENHRYSEHVNVVINGYRINHLETLQYKKPPNYWAKLDILASIDMYWLFDV